MSSVNNIVITGIISGESRTILNTTTPVVKRRMDISQHIPKFDPESDDEAKSTPAFLDLNFWYKNLQEEIQDLPEGTQILVIGSFHTYKHQVGPGQYEYERSINVEEFYIAVSEKPIASITLTGRASFGKESTPEVRYFESGSVLAKFSLAVNRPQKNVDPDWFDVKAWDGETQKLASRVADYLKKGDLIGVKGKLELSRYESKKNGSLVAKFEVKIDSFQFLTSKKDGESNPNSSPEVEHTPPEDSTPIPVKPVMETAAKKTKSKSKAADPQSVNLEDVLF